MIIEIQKGTSPKKIKKILSKRNLINKEIKVIDFFGKLPNIEDGLKFQKKVRNEWK
jgi:hypothetical protein